MDMEEAEVANYAHVFADNGLVQYGRSQGQAPPRHKRKLATVQAPASKKAADDGLQAKIVAHLKQSIKVMLDEEKLVQSIMVMLDEEEVGAMHARKLLQGNEEILYATSTNVEQGTLKIQSMVTQSSQREVIWAY